MRSPRITVYVDEQRQYRWRFVSNGRCLADGGQGYRHRADAVRGLESTLGGTVRDYAEWPRLTRSVPPRFYSSTGDPDERMTQTIPVHFHTGRKARQGATQ